MSGWLLLSDRDGPVGHELPAMLAQGTLVVELSWPLPVGVLLDWREPSGQALSVFHHPASGIGLMWRDGSALRRFLLPGPLRLDSRVARLIFHWNRVRARWTMRLEDGSGSTVAATAGLNPPALPAAMLLALCAGQRVTRREASVLWFGIREADDLPARQPWIGIAVPVMTPAGPVPAGLLRPGQVVLTRDAGPLPLRAVRRSEMPSRGSHAVIVLRAPRHARGMDLLVSADQMVAVGGGEAEYLFGEDQVLVPACTLVDGRTALADNRRATAAAVSLDLGRPHLLDCAGAGLLSAGLHADAPLRVLKEYEAVPLLLLLRRQRAIDAA
ncbi:hypothetical protein MASR1M32_42980 [Rhodobacter sp.]